MNPTDKVKIIVVCNSGVAMAMHVAYKLRGYFEKEKISVQIDGVDINELSSRAADYDIVVSNCQVDLELKMPVFDAIPLITGVDEEKLVQQIITKVKEVRAAKTNR